DNPARGRLAAHHRRLGRRRRRGCLLQHRHRPRQAAPPRTQPAPLADRDRPERRLPLDLRQRQCGDDAGGRRREHRQAGEEVPRPGGVPLAQSGRATADRADPSGAHRGARPRLRLTLCDVGPRDGLQNEPGTLPPATRAELVNRLAAAGLPRIEAASFVRPDAVPQVAGAEEVVAGIERRAGTEYSGLALNEKGYERLVATGLDRVNFTLAATETFSRRNANQSLEQAQAAAEQVLERSELPVTVTISVAFGCPFEGHVDPGVVAQ